MFLPTPTSNLIHTRAEQMLQEYWSFSETRVPVVNMNDGSMLCGDEAPKKRRLEQWLLEHPGYMISGQAASGLPLPGAVPEEQPPPPLPDLQAVSATYPSLPYCHYPNGH